MVRSQQRNIIVCYFDFDLTGTYSIPMRIVLAFSSFLTASAMTMMSDYDRSALPSRPVPLLSTTTTTTTTTTTSTTNAPPHRLDAARLLGLIRVGATVVSPTGTTAIVQTSQYDFAMKKANPQLWFLDLELAATLPDSELAQHRHLRLLTDGKQHDWSTISAPHYSPCGNYVAFVSNRKEKDKSSVWTLPLTGPGDASVRRIISLLLFSLSLFLFFPLLFSWSGLVVLFLPSNIILFSFLLYSY